MRGSLFVIILIIFCRAVKEPLDQFRRFSDGIRGHVEPYDAAVPAEPGHLPLGEPLDGIPQFFRHLLISHFPGQVPGQVFVFQPELY